MAKKTDYILVFDSGVGGISVLRQLRKCLPNERYLYFGDSANAPYGIKTAEEVCRLTRRCVGAQLASGVKAVVIACNTATSAAYETLVEYCPEQIVVGIEPALSMAAERHPGGHIGVLATPGTLAGDRFRRNKARFDGCCRITPLPAPGLMDLVEAGKYDSPEADALLHSFLDPYQGTLDAVVLGCTHYPFVENALRRVLGDTVELIDGAVITAAQTKQALEEAGLLYAGPGEVTMKNSLHEERILELSRQLAGLE